MRTFRRVLAGLAAGLAVTGLALSGASTARAAGPPGWRVVQEQDSPPPAQSEYSATVALAGNDAWVFGATNPANCCSND